MFHESENKSLLRISESSLNFSRIISMPYTPEEYMDDIKYANVLLIPEDRYQDGTWLFTEYTSEIYNYLKENASEDVKMDICISDKDYKKLELHSEVINLGEFLVTNVILSIFINLLSSYLYDKLRKNHKKPKDVNTSVNITVEKNGKSKKITYSGSVENFEKVLMDVKDNIFDD